MHRAKLVTHGALLAMKLFNSLEVHAHTNEYPHASERDDVDLHLLP